MIRPKMGTKARARVQEHRRHRRRTLAQITSLGQANLTLRESQEEFVDGKPWVHMDIAGPAFLESAKPWLDGGGSGMYVRTLVEVARRDLDGRV